MLDTALVRVSPDAYDRVIASYKTPIVNLLEVGLVGAVLYHALNGIRVILVDFWAKGPRYQRRCCGRSWPSGCVVMVPGAYFMLQAHRRSRCSGARHERRRASPALERPAQPAPAAQRAAQQLRAVLAGSSCGSPGSCWSFLVLGHLLIMNILDGGVQRINFGFVAGRWSSPFWQIWDLLHAVAGRCCTAPTACAPIINDYAERDQTRFWLKMLLLVATVLHRRSWAPW